MTRIKKQNLRYIGSTNKGFLLGAKIYSDVKGGCPCGGSFTAKSVLKGVEYPTCSSCGEVPGLFRIRAKIVHLDMREKYIDIRHTQGGDRLKDIFDCFSALKQVELELQTGSFDVRKYDSAQSKESYLFKNYSADYIAYNQKRMERGELSPYGFKNKKKYIKVLLKFFADTDISAIRGKQIDDFKNSFIDRFRTRDLALGELKALLNHAHKRDDIGSVPKFDLVPLSKKRKEIVPMDVALRVIANVEDPQYRLMIGLLARYPVRPCELRALQWRDVDQFTGVVKFQRHFSGDKLIDGRKSISGGEKACLTYPLVKELSAYLGSIPRSIDGSAFIFRGKEGSFVSEKCLSNAWRKATRSLRLPDHQLYELRHARLTEIAEQSNGDIVRMMKVSGHTNPKTLMERYVRSDADLREFFQ